MVVPAEGKFVHGEIDTENLIRHFKYQTNKLARAVSDVQWDVKKIRQIEAKVFEKFDRTLFAQKMEKCILEFSQSHRNVRFQPCNRTSFLKLNEFDWFLFQLSYRNGGIGFRRNWNSIGRIFSYQI